MSQSLINPYIFETVIPPPVTGDGAWIELKRTTLGAPSDNVTVSGLPNVEYYMVLADMPETVNLQPAIRFGDNGSPDVGANYASRRANNGQQPDVPSNTDPQIISNIADAAQRHWWEVWWISNLFKHEKLLVGRSARNITGNNLAPFRSEFAGKWVNNIPLDTITLTNLGAGDFQAGTEVVVLGWSRFDNNPVASNFWELLAEAEAVGGETIITTPAFTPRKYLWINGHSVPGAGGGSYQIRIGSGGVIDTSLNYHTRFANNEFGGGSESPNINNDHLIHTNLGTNTRTSSNWYCINLDGIEKIFHGRQFASGPGLVPPTFRSHSTVKWDGQSNALINIAQIFRNSGAATLQAGSKIQVWGHD